MFLTKQQDLVRKTREAKDHVCGCGLSAFNGRYNAFTFSLHRFRNVDHERYGGCSLGKVALEDGLHILWRGSLPAGRQYIIERYRALKQLCCDFCLLGINKILKDQTAMVKMGGEYIQTQWRLVCYWEQIYGYFPYIVVENMEAEARNWLETPNILTGFFTERICE